jgi:hypothetical protein
MCRSEDQSTPSDGGDGTPPTLLPRDLAASLRHLTEEDLLRLADALSVEMRSRRLVSRGQKVQPPRAGASDPVVSWLTRAQISLIRSSIQAGVKPAALSRQFGLTRAQITAALNSEEWKKGPVQGWPSLRQSGQRRLA